MLKRPIITTIAVKTMDAQFIGRMIRFHRKKSGLTQEQLGKFANLGKTVVFDVENGKLSVRLSTLLKLMEVLNIKMDFKSPLMHLFHEHLDEKS
jgi:transcriptional regulator with XRE-family HTH domain